MNKLRVAIYYDWLNQWGGAEKVLLNILKIFPDAELFTLFNDPKKTNWLPKNIKIHTSFLQRFPRSPLFSPLYDLAAENLNFSQFDIVISTTSNVGHCLLTSPQCLFVCYYHNLNRHLYLHPPAILRSILNLYKIFDKIYSQRPDYTLCNSQTTQSRLNKYLNLDTPIINPGIDTKYFIPTQNPTSNYFLIVGRLVAHKSLDYVIKTFINLNQKLIIVGTGRDENRLKNIANDAVNIQFVGQVSNEKLLTLYQNCRALICPQIEDFGLVSVEAQSCGRPVIALNDGGLTETVINHKTGILFDHQNISSLNQGLNEFNKLLFDSNIIRNHALNFDETIFMLDFKKRIENLWQQHQNQTKYL